MLRTCHHCKATWDLVERTYRVTSERHVTRLECRDRLDCEARWNRQHGYTWSAEYGLSRLSTSLVGARR